jgi:hypothetical protein
LKASYGVYGYFGSAPLELERLLRVTTAIGYEAEEDGAYRWQMWEWTGARRRGGRARPLRHLALPVTGRHCRPVFRRSFDTIRLARCVSGHVMLRSPVWMQAARGDPAILRAAREMEMLRTPVESSLPG